VLYGTEAFFAGCDDGCVKRRKSKTQRGKDTIAAVAEEMARPRYAVSTRRDEGVAVRRISKQKILG
jgi:hypothetical protein